MYYIVINSNVMIMTLEFLDEEYNKGKVYIHAKKGKHQKERKEN